MLQFVVIFLFCDFKSNASFFELILIQISRNNFVDFEIWCTSYATCLRVIILCCSVDRARVALGGLAQAAPRAALRQPPRLRRLHRVVHLHHRVHALG